MFRRSPPVVEYTPVVPERWTVKVREQTGQYSTTWDYAAIAPLGGAQAEYYGYCFKTRNSAIVAAIDMAEEVNRNIRNRNHEWETI